MDRKGQANMIVVLGMVAATIYILLNAFAYISNVGLSSTIEISAQNSISQTLSLKDYLIQEADYNFQKAQLFDGLTLQPSSVDCGYINTSQSLPFVPVPEVYYWRNLAGQVCLPNNDIIEYGLEHLLNQNSFAIVNSSNISIKSNLILNLSNKKNTLFSGNFSAPFLTHNYTFFYNSSSNEFSVCQQYKNSCNYTLTNAPIGVNFNMSGLEFTSLPPSDTLSGVIDLSTVTNAFFKDSGLSPSSQYALITFPNGNTAIIYSNTVNGVTSFTLTPMANKNFYTLKSIWAYNNANGIKNTTLINNSYAVYEGTNYSFSISSNVSGIFSIKPANYVMFDIQPQFIYYKYILNSIQNAGNENLLFPSNQNLYISYSVFPLYSPTVCVNYNEGQYNLQNCMTLSDSITGKNYLSELLKAGEAFVNESFPIGNENIEGFAQYEIDNYISNAINAVNLKTVSVNGKPKYDWYSALILQLGSPQGTTYLLNKLARVKEPYYGTYIYNCAQNASDLSYCRNLLSSTLSQDIISLLQQQMPQELTFLSGTNFNINVLNLSVNANEISSCTNASNYSVTSNYTYSVNSSPVKGNYSEEVLGIPISLEFGYQNSLNLKPTEACGIQKSPYSTGYSGFTQALVTNNITYINCAPVIAQSFLNNTCIASLETTNSKVASYLNSSSSAPAGEYCRSEANGQYFCPYYKVSSFSYKNWLTESNICPSYFVLDNENFTSSPNNNNYKLVSVYGGGADSSKMSFYNKTFALYNGTINLPENFSFTVGVNATGPYAGIDAFFSGKNNLNGNIISASFNSLNDPIGIYNYSVDTDSVDLLGGSNSFISPSASNQISLDRACTSLGCNLSSYLNSKFESSFFSNTSEITNNINLLGLATTSEPSSDLISYAFVSNYISSYTPILNQLPYVSASQLNSALNSSFGLRTDNNTYFNEFILNPINLTNSYQLKLNINTNFNIGYLLPGYIKIFGVYQNNNIKQFYWWNQTALNNGGIIWINTSAEVPSELYVVYGVGANGSSSYNNGTNVFPFFYSINQTGESFNFLYPNNNQHNLNAFYSVGGLNLTNEEPIPPYIYNATLSSYYGEFACINKNPFELTLLNGTYSAYPPSFNVNNLYNDFSTLYPDLTIIGKQTFTKWP